MAPSSLLDSPASVSAPTELPARSSSSSGDSDARRARLEQLPAQELKHLQAELTKAQLTKDDYSQKFDDLLTALEDRFAELADLVASGDITAADFRYRAERALRSGYTQAYRYGAGSVGGPVGLDDADVAAVVDAFSEDADYLAAFADQIASGYVPVSPEDRPSVDGEMLLSDRANMYANSTREMFFRGQVSRLPEDDVIEWVLGDTDHCNPCLDANDSSPYTPGTLPGYPGEICDGGSRCGCGLDYASQHAAQDEEAAA